MATKEEKESLLLTSTAFDNLHASLKRLNKLLHKEAFSKYADGSNTGVFRQAREELGNLQREIGFAEAAEQEAENRHKRWVDIHSV